MRRALLLALCAVVGFAAWRAFHGGDEPVPDGPGRTPPQPALPPFSYAQPPGWDIVIHVPRTWEDNYRPLSASEVHFHGPEDDGYYPELIFGWDRSDMTLAQWADGKIQALRQSPRDKIYATGDAVVAGMPAKVFTHGFTRQPRQGPAQEMREIAWFFVGHGHRGYVRGVCTVRSFPELRPVFEEAARRLAYRPK